MGLFLMRIRRFCGTHFGGGRRCTAQRADCYHLWSGFHRSPRMVATYRSILCDEVCFLASRHRPAPANGSTLPRRTREARHAGNLEFYHRCSGKTTFEASHVASLICSMSLVRNWGCPRGRCFPRHLCLCSRQRSSWFALVETNQPTHANACQRRMARHDLRRDLWSSRFLRCRSVLARRVSLGINTFPGTYVINVLSL